MMKTGRWGILFVLLAGAGCANRSVEDFCNQEAAEAAARMERERGTWSGMLRSSKDEPIAAVSISVSPETIGSGCSQSEALKQQVSLAGSVTILPPAGEPIQAGYRSGTYDSSNRDFHITIPMTRPDGTSSSVEIHGAFSDDGMTAAAWGGAFGEQYKSKLRLFRNGPIPQSSGLLARTAGGNPLAEKTRFTAMIPNPNPLDTAHPLEAVRLQFQSAMTSQQRFLSYFEPLTYVDMQLTLGYVRTPTSPGQTIAHSFYKYVEIDPRVPPRRFNARADGVQNLCGLDCVESGDAWSCNLLCPGSDPVPIPFAAEREEAR